MMTGPYRYQVGDKMLTTEQDLRDCFADVLARNVRYTRTAYTVHLVEPKGRWLDVGCGVGAMCYLISPKVESVLAIDIHEDSIKIARDIFNEQNIVYRSEKLFEMNLPSDSYDGVLFLEVIEHAINPFQFLQEIHRVLKPGGKLIISTPNALSYQQIVLNICMVTRKMLIRKLRKVRLRNYDFSTQ